jgi:hypothetical protein
MPHWRTVVGTDNDEDQALQDPALRRLVDSFAMTVPPRSRGSRCARSRSWSGVSSRSAPPHGQCRGRERVARAGTPAGSTTRRARAVRLLMVRTRLRTEAALGGGRPQSVAPRHAARSSTRYPRRTSTEAGGGGSGCPPGPASNVIHGTDGWKPTLGRFQLQTPVGNAAWSRANCASVNVLGG